MRDRISNLLQPELAKVGITSVTRVRVEGNDLVISTPTGRVIPGRLQDLAWIIHESVQVFRKKNLNRNRIRLCRKISISIVP